MGTARAWHTSDYNAVGGWRANGETRVRVLEEGRLGAADRRQPPSVFTLHWVTV